MTRAIKCVFCGLLLVACLGLAALGQDPLDLYQRAVVQLQAAGNLEGALKLFELAADRAGSDRALAAKALLGVAETYERLGKPHAYLTYEEITRKYPDQRDQVTVARARLASLSKSTLRWNFEGDNTGQQEKGWLGGAPQPPRIFPEVVDTGCVEGLRCLIIPTVENPSKSWWANWSPAGIGSYSPSGIKIDPYLNQKVHFRAAVRVEGPGARAQMWLRVDRIAGTKDRKNQASWFNNMDGNPITSERWAYYSLVGQVSPDSQFIGFGVMTYTNTKVWIDDVSFEIADPAEPLSRNFIRGNTP